jgi:hypothetical protein
MKYKDYEIEIGYNDMINCDELDLSALTVAEIKKAIDNHCAQVRNAKKESALFLEYGKDDIVEVIAGMAEKGRFNSSYRWITTKDSRKKRSKETSERLYRDTPEIREMLHEYKSLKDNAREAVKKADEYLRSIPSMAMDQE